MALMTGADALVLALKAEGVDTIFGIPGTHNLAIYDALYRDGHIRHITARHEQGAAFMADGYARASGRPGVCLTVTGAGATNAYTPIGQAYSDSSPVLLLCSQIETTRVGRDHELFHELKDSLQVFASVTTWRKRPMRADEIAPAVHEAFRRFKTGRPRPIMLEVPMDLLAAEEDLAIFPAEDYPRAQADPAAVERALGLLLGADRPVVFAGGGVRSAGCGATVAAIADLLGAPLTTSANGKGSIPENHHLFLGDGWSVHNVSHPVIEAADAMLAIGTRFGPQSTAYQKLKVPRTLVHVDIDPDEIGKHYPVALGLVGDAGAISGQILAALRAKGVKSRKCWANLAAARAARDARVAERAGPIVEILKDVRAALPRDGLLFNDLNTISYWTPGLFPSTHPRDYHYPVGYGVLGFAFPAAVGAKAACPDRACLALAGDGGFLYTVSELATAVANHIPAVAVVFNDNCYGAVMSDQLAHYEGRGLGCELVSPDFLRLAESFGAKGFKVDLFGLREALVEAFKSDVPVVIEAPVPPVAPPWLP